MSFRVTLARRDESFLVCPGETLLDAALAHGATIPNDCRSGYCRTCRTKVLSGEAIHILPQEEIALTSNELARGYRLLCSTIAQSDIVLDT